MPQANEELSDSARLTPAKPLLIRVRRVLTDRYCAPLAMEIIPGKRTRWRPASASPEPLGRSPNDVEASASQLAGKVATESDMPEVIGRRGLGVCLGNEGHGEGLCACGGRRVR